MSRVLIEGGAVLRIGWFWLFLLDLLRVGSRAILFMKSSLSSLFLFLEAGQFFPALLALISPSVFRQDDLLVGKKVYHGREEIPIGIEDPRGKLRARSSVGALHC